MKFLILSLLQTSLLVNSAPIKLVPLAVAALASTASTASTASSAKAPAPAFSSRFFGSRAEEVECFG
jgi:hypothetical protein